MFEATRFDGGCSQNDGLISFGTSNEGSQNLMIEHRQKIANITRMFDQRREEDLKICANMNQEQLFMLRTGMQIILIGMMNSLDLIITPVETVRWSLEDHMKLLENIKSWQKTYKLYLKELIDLKEIHEHKKFETWTMQNPADYETWSIKPEDKDIIGERSLDYITTYGKSFETEWNKGSREIRSLLSGLTPAGVVRILNNNDPCVISKIVITQLGPKYPQ